MFQINKQFVVVIGCLLLAGQLLAQPVINGDLAGDELFYGSALSIQNTNSGYGNSVNGSQTEAEGGSEIDQIFGRVVGDRLYVLIAGNLESNYNKLSLFFDSESGGMNEIDGSNTPAAVDPFCCPGTPAGTGALQRLDGLQFDNGFEADHFIGFSNGPETINATQVTTYSFSAYYGDLTAGPSGLKSDIGFQRFGRGVESGLDQGEPIDIANNACAGPSDIGCSPAAHLFAEQRSLLNDIDFRMAIDNSNTQGVNFGFGSATGNPASVTTGIEFSLPLSVLGNPTDDIRITTFIGNSQYTNISNQFGGDGVLQGNFGSNISGINLANIVGNQFVTIANGLPGDFNEDGSVDAADYTVWRDGLGTTYFASDYDLWANNYGVTDGANHVANYGAAATSSSRSESVPEPNSLFLTLICFVALTKNRRS